MNIGDTTIVYEDEYGVFWQGSPLRLLGMRQVGLEHVAGEIGEDQTLIDDKQATFISRAINQRIYKSPYDERFIVHSIELTALPTETGPQTKGKNNEDERRKEQLR